MLLQAERMLSLRSQEDRTRVFCFKHVSSALADGLMLLSVCVSISPTVHEAKLSTVTASLAQKSLVVFRSSDSKASRADVSNTTGPGL